MCGVSVWHACDVSVVFVLFDFVIVFDLVVCLICVYLFCVRVYVSLYLSVLLFCLFLLSLDVFVCACLRMSMCVWAFVFCVVSF